MDDQLLKSVVGISDESNKKKVICQCAATLFASAQLGCTLDQAVEYARKIVNQVYETV